MSVAKTLPEASHAPNSTEATQTSQRPPKRRRVRGSSRQSLIAIALERQLEIPLAIISLVLVGHASSSSPNEHLSTRWTPAPSFHYKSIFTRCIKLSFRKPGTDLYFKGRDDAYFIAFWVFVFAALREALMRWVFEPFARMAGIKERRNVIRFAEQGYAMVYAILSFSVGLYIMQSSEYRNLNAKHFWVGYPHDALPALTKWYYLVEAAFWIQQIITINLEARRKDYWQMFTHHIITTILMSLSYILNFTRIGSAILCTMDVVDILLPLAKLFKYTNRPQAADATFAVFLVTWIATRHVVFGRIMWSVYFESGRYLPWDWRPRDGYFHSYEMVTIFAVLLTALQVLLCIWTTMILRVVWKMLVVGASADDIRSDDEGDEGMEDEFDDENEEQEKQGAAEAPGLCKKNDDSTNGHAFANGKGENLPLLPNGYGDGNGHAASNGLKPVNGHVAGAAVHPNGLAGSNGHRPADRVREGKKDR